jgi:cell division protein FtsB
VLAQVSEDQKQLAAPQIARSSRRTRTRRVVHLLLLFITAVVFVDAVVGDGGVVVRQRRRNEYNQLVSELDRLKAANDLMREQNRRLRDDADALEEAARRDLGLMRRGETVFIIKDHRDHRDHPEHRDHMDPSDRGDDPSPPPP